SGRAHGVHGGGGRADRLAPGPPAGTHLHRPELRRARRGVRLRAAAHPIVFFKHPNTVAGPYDEAFIPKSSEKTDWEVELGIVIGKPVSYLETREEAAAAIAGYVVANDLSERAFQIEVSGGQWSKGKSSPGFSPLGPWVVTADEIDPHALAIRSWGHGEVR